MNTMPEPLRSHWDALDGEIIWLHGRWMIYRQLFGTSPERIDLLNRSAGTLFYLVQGVLMDSVQLTLSKLADSGKQNLTLASLLKDIDLLGDAILRGQLKSLLTSYRLKCEKVKNRRNKQLAHYDSHTLLSEKSSPLPGPSRQEIEDGLEALRAFMNTLQRKYTEAETAYDLFALRDGDVLLSVLKQGLRYQELVNTGVVSWDNLRDHP